MTSVSGAPGGSSNDKVVTVEGSQPEVIHVMRPDQTPQLIQLASTTGLQLSSSGALVAGSLPVGATGAAGAGGVQALTITTPAGNLAIPVSIPSLAATPVVSSDNVMILKESFEHRILNYRVTHRL